MNFPRLFLFFLLLLLLAFLPQLHAGVGDNNPTGIAGMFNGQVTTGGSYDPYTGNAHRVVTDITVAGAVGEYALGLTRTSNSRDTAGTAFGSPGAWRHNYQWLLQNSDPVSTFNNPPTHYEPPSYRVIFPDGRIETFTDTGGADPNFRTTAGVRERFKQLTALTDLCYLLLPDGGKVEFEATLVVEYGSNGDPNRYWNEYQAKAIIDPYGLRTTFTYDTNSPPRLSKVTEPANGRYLQFYYRTTPGQTHIVDHVTEFIAGVARRSVQYKYTTSAFPPGTTQYTALTSVEYYGVPTTWTARYTYVGPPNCGNVNGVPLLKTADDPMYAGPMHKIGYVYKTGLNADGTAPGCGQILSENYYNGTTVGAAVSTLTVTSSTTRTETRPFGETRTFIYTGPGYVGGEGYLAWVSDFQGHQYSQGYDENMYVNSVFDFNRIETNFTRYSISGNVTQIQYPLTPNDTVPPQTVRPTVNYSYGWAGCADPNNLDWSVPYYVCTAKDEAGHVTQFLRDTNKRITRINYPDGGYETFTYNSFGQVLSHRMTTGGTETFTYDTRGLKQTYRNPSNGIGNPTARYQYDAWDRLSGVTDALGSTTSFEYNLRGQLTKTTLPTDPVDGGRHTIVNAYNPNGDGTLISVTDQLGHVTSYTYDDYRRLTSVTTPARYTGDTTHTTSLFYDASGTSPDYKYADSKVTYVTLPSGKRIKASYDDNRRKISVITGFNTADAATTGYTYDNVGNLTSVIDPLDHDTTTDYDERNRPSSVSGAVGRVTTFKYDLGGRKYSETRPDGQVITFNSYDAMNRLLQLNVNQFPEPVAVTKYTYTQAGLLATMQDPRISSGTLSYGWTYDTMGRKTLATYPGTTVTEQFTYDTAGRLTTFKNRNGKVQTFTYDALNRMSYFTWDDNLTPRVDFGYDVGSRLITINNDNATISRTYFNDNLLSSETETITGVARIVSYTYNADGNRDSLQFPGYSFTYDYTGRNQLKKIVSGATTLATFGYDLNGNLSFRDLDNTTYTDYAYDQLDRVTDVRHYLNGTTRTFTYGNDTNSNNRKWTKRDDGNGDVFGYDLANQVAAVKLDIPNPDTTSVGAQTIIYDANGNRTSFSPYGTTDTYTINNLNQYSSRNGINAAYDANGNLTTGVDGSTYTYDAQNRLLSATKNGITMSFAYDGLNRQVSRWIDNGQKTYSAWDGGDLVQEYQEDQGAGVITAAYLYGPAGLVKELVSNNYYYQDGIGSTSHLADGDGALLEWYRYDLQGTPIIYDSLNNQLSTSNYGIRHLFTGQQWYLGVDLYDLRNRFYSPDIGRFLQPDPIGFDGDPTNLYRYVGNNPVTRSDPSGLDGEGWSKWTYKTEAIATANGVTVWGSWLPGALEHSLGGETMLAFSPSAHVGGGGSVGDGRGGGGFDITYGVRPTPLLSVPPIASSPLPPSPPLIANPNDPYYPIIPINPYNLQPLIFPSTVDPKALIAAAQLARGNAFASASVIYVLSPNGPLDRQLKLTNPLYQNAGNWLLGAEGHALGFPLASLLIMGGVTNYQVGAGAYGDDIEDSFMIELGYGH